MRPGEFIDYYEILGLAPGASADDVREAWRRCARQYHPDLNPRKTSFRFRRAREAYDVLSDPVRRRDYDRLYRVKTGVFGRSASRRRPGTAPGTPPGGRTPPSTGARPSGPPGPAGRPRPASTGSPAGAPRPGTTPPGAGGASTRPGAGVPPRGTGVPPTGAPSTGASSTNASSPGSAAPGTGQTGGKSTGAPPGARGAPAGSRPTPGPSDVRTRTTFRPATIFREVHGKGIVDYLKDAVSHGGASRITVRHNGNIVWQAQVTSALMDDITRWLVGPLAALLRLLGAEEKFQVEIANELVEDYNRGNTLYDDGKLEDAKSAYKRCIDRDRYFAPAYLSLGAVYEAQQDIPVAIKLYQNAVKIDPAGEAGRFARENLRRLRGY